MAEILPAIRDKQLFGIKILLWGSEIKADIFKRWSQGFYFSVSEPTALEQAEGGPCAIIAPLQAFILKGLLDKHRDLSFRDQEVSPEMQSQLLIDALTDILAQCNSQKYCIVYLNRVEAVKSDETGENIGVSPSVSATFSDDTSCATTSTQNEADSDTFHANLRMFQFGSLADVNKYYSENIDQLKARFGVLLFLYSVIATRGLEAVQTDGSGDELDPLIDGVYGYGSQSLINLMITGRATTYVWDHEQDVGGLKLRGLEKQSQIGFITLMEHLRFCTVGSFYKNPIHPVWVLGSETHLTTLFSTERRLVSPETKTEEARRVFRHFDPDGNNFINAGLLENVLEALDLVSEKAYVDIMRKKLDPESLGIILLNAFMDEFFPKEENRLPDVFYLMHYNGLAQSNIDGRIKYRLGECVLLESDLSAISESNSMLTVLQTKWPAIEVRWDGNNRTPSLN